MGGLVLASWVMFLGRVGARAKARNGRSAGGLPPRHLPPRPHHLPSPRRVVRAEPTLPPVMTARDAEVGGAAPSPTARPPASPAPPRVAVAVPLAKITASSWSVPRGPRAHRVTVSRIARAVRASISRACVPDVATSSVTERGARAPVRASSCKRSWVPSWPPRWSRPAGSRSGGSINAGAPQERARCGSIRLRRGCALRHVA